MSTIPCYQVDSFTNQLFSGNPAAVVPLESWLPDTTMQQIAAENNLSETAFFVQQGDTFHLRWFTPEQEVDLCGHATLASAFVLFDLLDYQNPIITFDTRSGPLTVERRDLLLVMDFPARPPEQLDVLPVIARALGVEPIWAGCANFWLLLLKDEEQLLQVKPDFQQLLASTEKGVIITAPGNEPEIDFVSRFFAPNVGINEDPVTGSAHCVLVPFWADRLDKTVLKAKQLSARGGELSCELLEDKVKLSGECKLYSSGQLYLE